MSLHRFIQETLFMDVIKLPYRLQGTQSIACGIYAIYFIYFLSHQSIQRVLLCIPAKFIEGQFANNDKLTLHQAYVI